MNTPLTKSLKPQDENLRESCTIKHERRCDYCDLLDTCAKDIGALFVELGNIGGDRKFHDKVGEWSYDIDKAFDDIIYYKRTVMRAKIASDYWEKQFEKRDPTTVLVTR